MLPGLKEKPLLLLPHRLAGNMYLGLLGHAYQQAGINIVYGSENLVESTCPFDAIHLQWPEEQYRGPGSGTPDAKAAVFLRKLDQHKQAGGKLIWTVHNVEPHEHGKSDLDSDVYQSVIDRADLIVHHCPHSVELLAAAYKMRDSTASIVVPFGNYAGYADSVNRQEARARLRIPDDAMVYLCFGAIRGYKGLDTLLGAYKRARVANKFLVVAGYYTGAGGWKGKLETLRLTLMDRFDRNVRMDLKMIDDDDVQIYFRAADAVVLSHSRGLNSGVAILGMTFGNLVIGPDLGCIGNVLQQGRNLVYRANDVADLVKAMEAVPTLDLTDAQMINARVAASWQWADVVRAIVERLGGLGAVNA